MKKITSDNTITYVTNTLRGFRNMMVCLEQTGYQLYNTKGFFDRKYIYKTEHPNVFTINLKLEEI